MVLRIPRDKRVFCYVALTFFQLPAFGDPKEPSYILGRTPTLAISVRMQRPGSPRLTCA